MYLDLETYSECPIKYGVHRYAEDPSTEIMVATWAIDDGPVMCWEFGWSPERVAEAFTAAMDAADEIVAHNAAFDRTVMHHLWPDADQPAEKWRCTMTQAYAHALPGSLDTLGVVLGIPLDQRKLADGRSLIHLFCKPRPASFNLRRADRDSHPAEWQRFLEYARNDIEALRAIDVRLPRWNYPDNERALRLLDHRINERGFFVDREFAASAIAAASAAVQHHDSATRERTAGSVGSTRQRDELLAFLLQVHGVTLPDLQADTIQRRLDDPELPEEVKELLRIRLLASKTSTSKYKALLHGVSADGRLRGTTQLYGAGRTGRWAGRIFQPHNLPRQTMKHSDIEIGIAAAEAGCADLVVDDVMTFAANAVRGSITATPGNKLAVADLSNIEGRKAAWLAGEGWKTEAFRQFDAGTGPDLYKLAYAKAFQIDPADVQKPQRQIGKVMELMLQYEGGVGAFLTGAATYNIDLDAMADAAWSTIPSHIVQESSDFADWLSAKHKDPEKKRAALFGLDRRTFVVCDALKRMWRRAHPNITDYWPMLADAARMAIMNPGVVYPARRIQFRKDGNWLRMRLPSGRFLCYPSPAVDDQGKITYMGVNQYTKKWSRLGTYGGKLFENACQASSRDILAHGMLLAEEAGYAIVLHVHDELVADVPDTEAFTAAGLAALMSTNPSWAEGLPLAAAGFETFRYRKE